MQIIESKKTDWERCQEVNKPSKDDPGYGQAVIDYVIEWADNMESEMLKTLLPVADVAKECEPKGHGITGFQYGAAVQILAEFWVHGNALRKWHNTNYGMPDAVGTVNPAILTLGD